MFETCKLMEATYPWTKGMTTSHRPEDPCDGSYRHFPGQSYPAEAAWEWTAPYRGSPSPRGVRVVFGSR